MIIFDRVGGGGRRRGQGLQMGAVRGQIRWIGGS